MNRHGDAKLTDLLQTAAYCIEAAVFLHQPNYEPRDVSTLCFVTPDPEDLHGIRQRLAHC